MAQIRSLEDQSRLKLKAEKRDLEIEVGWLKETMKSKNEVICLLKAKLRRSEADLSSLQEYLTLHISILSTKHLPHHPSDQDANPELNSAVPGQSPFTTQLDHTLSSEKTTDNLHTKPISQLSTALPSQALQTLPLIRSNIVEKVKSQQHNMMHRGSSSLDDQFTIGISPKSKDRKLDKIFKKVKVRVSNSPEDSIVSNHPPVHPVHLSHHLHSDQDANKEPSSAVPGQYPLTNTQLDQTLSSETTDLLHTKPASQLATTVPSQAVQNLPNIRSTMVRQCHRRELEADCPPAMKLRNRNYQCDECSAKFSIISKLNRHRHCMHGIWYSSMLDDQDLFTPSKVSEKNKTSQLGKLAKKVKVRVSNSPEASIASLTNNLVNDRPAKQVRCPDCGRMLLENSLVVHMDKWCKGGIEKEDFDRNGESGAGGGGDRDTGEKIAFKLRSAIGRVNGVGLNLNLQVKPSIKVGKVMDKYSGRMAITMDRLEFRCNGRVLGLEEEVKGLEDQTVWVNVVGVKWEESS